MGMNHSPRGPARVEVEARILEYLRAEPEGISKADLVRRLDSSSAPTIQRVLKSLENDGVAERDKRRNKWVLRDPHYRVSLDVPDVDDLQAVLIAEALLGSLADEDLRGRIRSLAEQLDDRIRERGKPSRVVRTAVDVTVTSATRFRTEVLHTLLQAVRKSAVRITQNSPWSGRSERTVEPWALRLHNSAWYVRAFDRKHGEARTFRLAHIERAVQLPDSGPPTARPPSAEEIWSNAGDPAFGIDRDRPDKARVVMRGQISQWLEHVVWHPSQQDRRLDNGDLERTLPYSSCREFARTLRAYLDAIVELEPKELKAQVLAFDPI